MPIISSVTNFFSTVFESSVTMSLGTTIAPGATTISVNGMTNYSNGQVVVFTIDPTNSAKQVFTGTVSGTTVINVVWTYGSNVTHTSGASIIDYVSSTDWDMLTTGILKQHNQNGTHQALTNTGGLTTDTLSVTSSASITNPSPVGLVSGWIGANETWSYASSTTITVPTNATTKYDVGDYLQLTQSSTVKYFVVTGVAATVLTVVGVAGATVANSTITLNSYFKANPHSIGAGAIFNPYKFAVWLSNGSQSTTNGVSKVNFDNKFYDTSTNIDVATNKGRFTAPVAGFYNFDFTVNTAGGNSSYIAAQLWKNGAVLLQGDQSAPSTSAQSNHVSDTLQLSANDYIEPYVAASAVNTISGFTGGYYYTRFSGFLVSQL